MTHWEKVYDLNGEYAGCIYVIDGRVFYEDRSGNSHRCHSIEMARWWLVNARVAA